MKKILLLLLISFGLCFAACKASDDNRETKAETDYSEGSPSKESIDLQGSTGYSVGDTIIFETDMLSYELTIDKVSYIEVENEYGNTKTQVVLVDYTYKNNGDGFLLIDDMRFQLVSANNDRVYEPYYYEGLVSADLSENGQSVSAQIAFEQDDNNDAALVYKDTADESIKPVYICIDEIS